MVADRISYGQLKENARVNRGNQTEAESVFWDVVKSNGLGQKCRRQYIIGEYIVDFFFRESKLIVEIDGEYHNNPEQKEMDRIRQDWLEHMGYHLIRFNNEDVLFNIDNVVEKIKFSLTNLSLSKL